MLEGDRGPIAIRPTCPGRLGGGHANRSPPHTALADTAPMTSSPGTRRMRHRSHPLVFSRTRQLRACNLLESRLARGLLLEFRLARGLLLEFRLARPGLLEMRLARVNLPRSRFARLTKRNSGRIALAKRYFENTALAKRKTDRASLAKRDSGRSLPRQPQKRQKPGGQPVKSDVPCSITHPAVPRCA